MRCVGKVERFGPKTKFEPLRKAKLATRPASTLTSPRPRRLFCPHVPKRPEAGAAKSVLSYY